MNEFENVLIWRQTQLHTDGHRETLRHTQGWQGGLIRLKKAGLNRMDKTGFFQTIFEKIRFEDNSKNFAEISSAT